MIDLNEIQAFLSKGIIKVKDKETTLFDIAGFPHYENVVSNIYAYFFDPSQPHGLGTLFIDSLSKSIGADFTFITPDVHREYPSKKGGRIDLVILDKDRESKKVIIIENKMYHNLHNDLKDYYDSFPGLTKQGVLLTINPTKSYHNHFANITHRDLINKVFQDMGQLILSIPDQALFILKEFSKNLNNFTMDHDIGNYYNFYQKNCKTIAQVENLTNKIRSHMWSQINTAPQLMADLNLSLAAKGNDYFRYYKSNKTDAVFITVSPHLLNDELPYIEIIIELNQSGIDKLNEINSLVLTEDEKQILKETTPVRRGWLHYTSCKFDVNRTDFENLGEFIKEKVESTSIKSVFLKIEAYFALKKIEQDLSYVAAN